MLNLGNLDAGLSIQGNFIVRLDSSPAESVFPIEHADSILYVAQCIVLPRYS